jgi:predicted nucleic acid-binding protein
MPISYKIEAEVIDIKTDTPIQEDIFLVDTNVWYWMTYHRASSATRPPFSYQTNDYPTYISKVLTAKSKLVRCGLSLAELSHIIERTELEIYNRTAGQIRPKEYRHNIPTERNKVITEIKTAWGQVKSMASPLEDVIIDENTTDNALSRLDTQKLDGYDLFMLESIEKTGIVQIITDDGDFATVPNLKVFTSNQNVIQAAAAQGKLITR